MNGLNRESYKYSPVKLLEDISPVETASHHHVAEGKTDELVTIFERGTQERGRLVIEVAPRAHLHHWFIFCESEDSVHLEDIEVRVGANASYTLNALTIGSKWSRSDFRVRLMGENAGCQLFGLDLASGTHHIDRHLLLEHEVPKTTSVQLFKGVFDDNASASFYGKIKVLHGADGSSASQTNRNLLLSGSATVNTRPQLEIDTDDVSCTHGATVGQLDENAVFFLRARGIAEPEARAMLTQAFASEVLARFKDSVHKQEIERRVIAWLRREGR